MNGSSNSGRAGFFILLACLAVVLAILFQDAFHPDKVIFSNDGPLGVMSADSFRYPDILTGAWFDLNWLGFNGGAAGPNITALVAMTLKPLYYAKFLAPISVLFLGLCAWVFFNQLGLSPGPSVLAAIAMALNSNIFSNVCWGLGSRAHAVGMFFLALAALLPGKTRLLWLRIILSGLSIGMAVMEAGDNGAIMSFYLAAFVLFQAWTEANDPAAIRLAKGGLRLVIIAVFAGFIATQGIISLYVVGIKNASGVSTGSDTVRSRTEQWDWATQWSLPKGELLRVIIPGLYGYRMDTEEGGNYWGAVGRTPGWEQTHAGIARHSGAGEYAGVLVILIAVWAVAQAGRKEASVFTPMERRWIWFWTIAAGISILLAVGRYAPFYRIIYSIPYFSAIRNPMKFMHPAHVSFVILFAYGLQGMLRRYFTPTPAPAKTRAPVPPPASWWAALPRFERRWIVGCGIAFACAVLGWMMYSSSRTALEKHLLETGFPNEGMPGIAEAISRFSVAQAGWFVLFLAVAVVLIVLIVKGTFAGPRAKVGFALLGLFLVIDLGVANKPWIKSVNYKEKYATNPLIDVLRQKPYEHRVTMLRGFQVPRELQMFQAWLQNAYGGDWSQLLFPYFNIHSLDVTQLSRRPEEYVQFEENTFGLTSIERLKIQDRHWQLTTTPYVLGLMGYSAPFKEFTGVDLKVHSRYTLAPKPGVSQPRTYDDLTVAPKEDGQIALFEVPNTLPRVKLYTQWQVNTNIQETLKTLADKAFDYQNTVLLDEPLTSKQSGVTTNATANFAEIAQYAPKRIAIKASASAPAVLLMNDKFDPDWKVLVDGRPDKIMRANYVMRGIFLQPGSHTVVLSFEPSLRWLYVSLAGIALGVLLGLALLVASLRSRDAKTAG